MSKRCRHRGWILGVITEIPLDQNVDVLVTVLEAKHNNQKIHILKASRIKNRYQQPTGAARLTFFGDIIPESVRIAESLLDIPVAPFIVPPVRCFKCHVYGKCPNNNTRCARCAESHETRGCLNTIMCCPNLPPTGARPVSKQ